MYDSPGKAVSLLLALVGSVALAQPATPASAPAFDVATIKIHSDNGPLSVVGASNSPDGVTETYATLAMMVQYAHGLLSEDQVTGIPDWARDLRFDVQAKMSEADVARMNQLAPDAQKTFRQQMMQSLLADRFHLTAHSQTRQVPVYELVVAKGGPRLKETSDSNPRVVRDKGGKPYHGYMMFFSDHMTAQAYTMQALADFLSQPMCNLGRPVSNKTGLTAAYDFTLAWSPNLKNLIPSPGSSAASSPADATDLFSALGELGLKLQPATGPIEIIVIDHAEKPSAN